MITIQCSYLKREIIYEKKWVAACVEKILFKLNKTEQQQQQPQQFLINGNEKEEFYFKNHNAHILLSEGFIYFHICQFGGYAEQKSHDNFPHVLQWKRRDECKS